VRIGAHDLAQRVLVVAEIGNNHEGSVDVARRLVVEAARAGADAVKFQTFRADELVAPTDAERLRRLRSFELEPEHFAELAELAHAEGLLFLSTPLDLGSADFLANVVDAFKIASGDIDFVQLLRRADPGEALHARPGVLGLPRPRALRRP
jgi:sialic acid synthase SpsE